MKRRILASLRADRSLTWLRRRDSQYAPLYLRAHGVSLTGLPLRYMVEPPVDCPCYGPIDECVPDRNSPGGNEGLALGTRADFARGHTELSKVHRAGFTRSATGTARALMLNLNPNSRQL